VGKRTVTRRVVIAPAALEDLNWWRRTNPKRADRVRRMLEAVLLDPFGGIGKPEPLRGLPNTWSRRIDQRHRLVYRVFDDRIELVAARYHYDE
jgi:toxin YoeB